MATVADKPVPKDLSHHFSRLTKKRLPSQVKRFYQYFSIPGIGNLAGGLPYPKYFPYDTLEASTALPDRFKPTPNKPVDPPTAEFSKATLSDGPAASRVLVPHDSSEPNLLRKIDLTTALQYGTAQGYPPLYSFVRDFVQNHLHPNVPYKGGAEVILTCGSTDGFSKALEAFTNNWDEERDWIREREGILCEEFAYMNAIQTAKPRGLNVVPVAIDDEGMLAYGNGGLEDVLTSWDKNKGKRPHLIYTVTMGQNPTSGLLSLKRRKEIYALAQKFDILILEDDPYWNLQYPSANRLSMEARGHPVSGNFPINVDHNYNTASGGRSSGYPFLDSLVPSYLSIDIDGRVVRIDTFSKTVAPGARLGWITAQAAIIEKIQLITETSTQQPSGFVQSLIAELLLGPSSASDPGKGGSKDGSGWKVDGWVRWLEGLRGNYERRMQIMSNILEEGKYLIQDSSPRSTGLSAGEEEYQLLHKTQLYDFTYPMAGMFLWLRANFETHPLFEEVTGPRLAQALWIFFTKKPYLVLLGPGAMFSPTQKVLEEKGWQYFRLCFAAVDDDLVEKHSRGTVSGFADFWAIDDAKKIDELLDDAEAESRVREIIAGTQRSAKRGDRKAFADNSNSRRSSSTSMLSRQILALTYREIARDGAQAENKELYPSLLTDKKVVPTAMRGISHQAEQPAAPTGLERAPQIEVTPSRHDSDGREYKSQKRADKEVAPATHSDDLLRRATTAGLSTYQPESADRHGWSGAHSPSSGTANRARRTLNREHVSAHDQAVSPATSSKADSMRPEDMQIDNPHLEKQPSESAVHDFALDRFQALVGGHGLQTSGSDLEVEDARRRVQVFADTADADDVAAHLPPNIDWEEYQQQPQQGLEPRRSRVAREQAHFYNSWGLVRHRLRQPFAEWLGTVVFMTIGLSASVVHTTSQNGFENILAAYLAWGFGVMMGIYIAGGVSGAHLNPALSIVLSVYRGFPWSLCWQSILAQIIGALTASAIVYGLYKDAVMQYAAADVARAGPAFYTQPRDGLSNSSAFFTEFVATAIVAGSVLALGDEANAPPGAGMHAFIIGLLVSTLCMAFSYNTGTCLNPARDLGPRLIVWAAGFGSDVMTFRSYWFVWGPWCGTMSGAIFGGAVYDVFIFVGGESPINYPAKTLRPHFSWSEARGKSRTGRGKEKEKDVQDMI